MKLVPAWLCAGKVRDSSFNHRGNLWNSCSVVYVPGKIRKMFVTTVEFL